MNVVAGCVVVLLKGDVFYSVRMLWLGLGWCVWFFVVEMFCHVFMHGAMHFFGGPFRSVLDFAVQQEDK